MKLISQILEGTELESEYDNAKQEFFRPNSISTINISIKNIVDSINGVPINDSQNLLFFPTINVLKNAQNTFYLFSKNSWKDIEKYPDMLDLKNRVIAGNLTYLDIIITRNETV